MDAAEQHHYNRHSRHSPMSDCNQPECRKATKASRKEPVKETATWTRAELKTQAGFTDQRIDDTIAECQRVADLMMVPNPLQVTGEPGDDQLIRIDPEFAALLGLT